MKKVFEKPIVVLESFQAEENVMTYDPWTAMSVTFEDYE